MQLKGRHAVNIQAILERFDPSGAHTKLIGARVFMLQKDHMVTRWVVVDTQLSPIVMLVVNDMRSTASCLL
jgi:hypothetical protein